MSTFSLSASTRAAGPVGAEFAAEDIPTTSTAGGGFVEVWRDEAVALKEEIKHARTVLGQSAAGLADEDVANAALQERDSQRLALVH